MGEADGVEGLASEGVGEEGSGDSGDSEDRDGDPEREPDGEAFAVVTEAPGLECAAVEGLRADGDDVAGRCGAAEVGAGVVTTPMIVCRSTGVGAGRTSRYAARTTAKAAASTTVERRARSRGGIVGLTMTSQYWAGLIRGQRAG